MQNLASQPNAFVIYPIKLNIFSLNVIFSKCCKYFNLTDVWIFKLVLCWTLENSNCSIVLVWNFATVPMFRILFWKTLQRFQCFWNFFLDAKIVIVPIFQNVFSDFETLKCFLGPYSLGMFNCSSMRSWIGLFAQDCCTVPISFSWFLKC